MLDLSEAHLQHPNPRDAMLRLRLQEPGHPDESRLHHGHDRK